jgi:hypothetical protein
VITHNRLQIFAAMERSFFISRSVQHGCGTGKVIGRCYWTFWRSAVGAVQFLTGVPLSSVRGLELVDRGAETVHGDSRLSS